MQPMPDTGSLPLAQPAPAGHSTTEAQLLRQVFPRNTGVKYEQDAIECQLIVHSRAPTVGRRLDLWQQRLELLPQRRTHFSLSCHASSNAAHRIGEDMVLLAALSRVGLDTFWQEALGRADGVGLRFQDRHVRLPLVPKLHRSINQCAPHGNDCAIAASEMLA